MILTESPALAMQVCAPNVSGSISCLTLCSCGLDGGWTHKSDCAYQRIILHVYYAFWESGICASAVESWLWPCPERRIAEDGSLRAP